MRWQTTTTVAPDVVDWYVDQAYPTIAPRGMKKLIAYRLGRRYTKSGLPSIGVPRRR
jgi:hypothetical protein